MTEAKNTKIINNGLYYERHESVSLQIIEPFTVYEVIDKKALLGSNIRISGFNFIKTQGVSCLIGKIRGHATIVDSQNALCRLSTEISPQKYAVKLSLNDGINYSKDDPKMAVSVYENPRLIEVRPLASPTLGNTHVNKVGD